MSKLRLASIFTLALAVTLPVCANSIGVSSGPFNTTSSLSVATFDGGSMPSNYTTTGSAVGVVSGSMTNVYAAPMGDTTPYAYVGPNSSLTVSYASAPVSAFGLYWGSVDSYNSLAFTDSNGVVTTYGAGGMSLANVLSVDTNTSKYVTFFDSGAKWTSVKFTSGASAFEFDNVGTATPEPGSLAMIAGGLLALGAGVLRRRSVN